LHDRADILPLGSPERPALDRDAADARRYAFGFGAVASLLAVTSALLLLFQPASGDATSAGETAHTHPSTQLTPTLGKSHVGVVCDGTF